MERRSGAATAQQPADECSSSHSVDDNQGVGRNNDMLDCALDRPAKLKWIVGNLQHTHYLFFMAEFDIRVSNSDCSLIAIKQLPSVTKFLTRCSVCHLFVEVWMFNRKNFVQPQTFVIKLVKYNSESCNLVQAFRKMCKKL